MDTLATGLLGLCAVLLWTISRNIETLNENLKRIIDRLNQK